MEVSLKSKIEIQREAYLSTKWLQRKKGERTSPIDPYGRRLVKLLEIGIVLIVSRSKRGAGWASPISVTLVDCGRSVVSCGCRGTKLSSILKNWSTTSRLPTY
ncbi:hypothetical protein BKA56DRAFT_603684 [Ilyonectria sp. MPI-CAGE-AT-0026]|nr:hypothetical protein BKA56DRAFT_603684 [Ilyonectria sp. MPI-CAGE-AT-0026]